MAKVEAEHHKKFRRIRKDFKHHQRLQDEYTALVLMLDTENQGSGDIARQLR